MIQVLKQAGSKRFGIYNVEGKEVKTLIEGGFHFKSSAEAVAETYRRGDNQTECPRNLRAGQPCNCPDCN